MHIPVKPESVDDFIERVFGLLQDKRTHVYFDTSFLMWLTTIGPASRQQFLAWTGTLGDRTHVPLWSMHEYYRHHRNRTLERRLAKGSRKLDAAEGLYQRRRALCRPAFAAGSAGRGLP